MNLETIREDLQKIVMDQKAIEAFQEHRRGPVVPRKFLWNFQGHSKTIKVFEGNGRTQKPLGQKGL